MHLQIKLQQDLQARLQLQLHQNRLAHRKRENSRAKESQILQRICKRLLGTDPCQTLLQHCSYSHALFAITTLPMAKCCILLAVFGFLLFRCACQTEVGLALVLVLRLYFYCLCVLQMAAS